MKWRTTGLLVALAVVMFAFIWLVERRVPGRGDARGPQRLFTFKAADVTNIQLRLTNQLLLRVERTNATAPWNLSLPIAYPAQPYAIEGLLQSLETLAARVSITADELAARQKSIAEFGLDVPAATLTLQHGGLRTEILFGAKTPVGDQVYLQVQSAPGLYLVNAELFDRLPRSSTDWRDTSLFSAAGFSFDRIEVRAPSRSFAVVIDPTNKVFLLTKPTPARADRAKVDALLRTIVAGRVVQFITDSRSVDLEPYGLQTPEAELVFGLGTNDGLAVQFGKSPTNDPTVVYARRQSHTNIVLVPRPLLEALQIAPTELRDRHLVALPNGQVDQIEIIGTENFTVRRQTNDTWLVGEPPMQADRGLMRDWINLLGKLEGTIEKDVVTDFASYGLAKPFRQYLLKANTTNAAGLATNRLLGQIDIGTVRDEKAFARRTDEQSVYSIGIVDFERLPGAAWQLRDRRVFAFTTNQVSRVTLRHRGYARTLLRNGPADWSLAPGSQGIINPLAIEETIFKLGELRAAVWTARGDQARSFLGFSDSGHKITIDLKNGDKPNPLTLEFGTFAPSKFPYAQATLDGQSWIFEFPLGLYIQVLRDLSNPPPPADRVL